VVPEMALAEDKAQRDELAVLARSRPLCEVDNMPMTREDGKAAWGMAGPGAVTRGLDRISAMDAAAQEDSLRHMHVLAPTRNTLGDAYRHRY